jgi:sulfur relay (sulfurtransferase) complex TusBCD TusD component (DsrE family)
MTRGSGAARLKGGQDGPGQLNPRRRSLPIRRAGIVKLGIVVYSGDAETVWNAFRLGSLALSNGDSVSVFLLAKGVEAEQLDTEAYPVSAKLVEFVSAGGKVMSCGTCLVARSLEASQYCRSATMGSLYELIKDSDKVISL